MIQFLTFLKMPGFVPHLSNLELIRQAGIFYPRITDLTGKQDENNLIQILISNYIVFRLRFQSTSNYNIALRSQYRLRNYLHFQFPYMIKETIYLHKYPSILFAINSIFRDGRTPTKPKRNDRKVKLILHFNVLQLQVAVLKRNKMKR